MDIEGNTAVDASIASLDDEKINVAEGKGTLSGSSTVEHGGAVGTSIDINDELDTNNEGIDVEPKTWQQQHDSSETKLLQYELARLSAVELLVPGDLAWIALEGFCTSCWTPCVIKAIVQDKDEWKNEADEEEDFFAEDEGLRNDTISPLPTLPLTVSGQTCNRNSVMNLWSSGLVSKNRRAYSVKRTSVSNAAGDTDEGDENNLTQYIVVLDNGKEVNATSDNVWKRQNPRHEFNILDVSESMSGDYSSRAIKEMVVGASERGEHEYDPWLTLKCRNSAVRVTASGGAQTSAFDLQVGKAPSILGLILFEK